MAVRFDTNSNNRDDGKSEYKTYHPGADERDYAEILGYKSNTARDATNDVTERTGRDLRADLNEAQADVKTSLDALVAGGYITQEDANVVIGRFADAGNNEDDRWRTAMFAEYLNDIEEIVAEDPTFLDSPTVSNFLMSNNGTPGIAAVYDGFMTSNMDGSAGVSSYAVSRFNWVNVRTPQHELEISAVTALGEGVKNDSLTLDQAQIIFGGYDATTFDSSVSTLGLSNDTVKSLFNNIDMANPTPEQTVALQYLDALADQQTKHNTNGGATYVDDNSTTGTWHNYDAVSMTGDDWSGLAAAMEANDLEAINAILLPKFDDEYIGITPEMVDAYVPTVQAEQQAQAEAEAQAQAQAEADAAEAEKHAQAVDSYDGSSLASQCYAITNLQSSGITIDGEKFTVQEFARMNGIDPQSIPQYTSEQWNADVRDAVKDDLQTNVDAAILESDSLTELLASANNTTECKYIVSAALGIPYDDLVTLESTEFGYGYADAQNPETGEPYTYVEYLEAKYGDQFDELHNELAAELEIAEEDLDEEQSDDNSGPADEEESAPNDEEQEEEQEESSDPNYEDEGEQDTDSYDYDQRAADFAMFTYMTAHDGAFGRGFEHRAQEFEKYCVENGYPYTAEDFGEVQGMVDDLIINNAWDYTTIPGWSDYQASLGKEVEVEDENQDTNAYDPQDPQGEGDQEESGNNDQEDQNEEDFTDMEENDGGTYTINTQIPGMPADESGFVYKDYTAEDQTVITYPTFADPDAAAQAYQFASTIEGLSNAQINEMIKDPSAASNYFGDNATFAQDYFQGINDQIVASGQTFGDAEYGKLSGQIISDASEATNAYEQIKAQDPTPQAENQGTQYGNM